MGKISEHQSLVSISEFIPFKANKKRRTGPYQHEIRFKQTLIDKFKQLPRQTLTVLE